MRAAKSPASPRATTSAWPCPDALATTRLPGWWRQWAADGGLSCAVEVGNVRDTVSAFTAGSVDLLGDMAAQGFGVAWLPDSSFSGGRLQELLPVGRGAWDVEVSVMAYRSKANARRAVGQVWERIVGPSAAAA